MTAWPAERNPRVAHENKALMLELRSPTGDTLAIGLGRDESAKNRSGSSALVAAWATMEVPTPRRAPRARPA